ncbi:DUF4124 domain-containing protein [Streptantibioticus rubrisoli]|uniref:DUF4124 domain-containing protein n=1 Tax=Streptantibioticus rubrisoli TaxID=1387313 RepID=UPI0035579555
MPVSRRSGGLSPGRRLRVDYSGRAATALDNTRRRCRGPCALAQPAGEAAVYGWVDLTGMTHAGSLPCRSNTTAPIDIVGALVRLSSSGGSGMESDVASLGFALQGGPSPHSPAVARGRRATSPVGPKPIASYLAFSGIAASPPSASPGLPGPRTTGASDSA